MTAEQWWALAFVGAIALACPVALFEEWRRDWQRTRWARMNRGAR